MMNQQPNVDNNDDHNYVEVVVAHLEEENEGEEEEKDQEEDEEEDPWENTPQPFPDVLITGLEANTVMPDSNDPRRMGLTDAEWQVAYRIKSVVVTDDELNDLSDFWYSQLAIICLLTNPNINAGGHGAGNIPIEAEALNIAIEMQEFQKTYQVRDTLQEGCRAIQEFVEFVPKGLLHYGFSENHGTYMLATDQVCLDFGAFNSDKNFRKLVVGSYYILHAMNCDMKTIRQGATVLTECGKVGWTIKTDFKIQKELFLQLASIYPMKMTGRYYNAGVIFNLLFSTAKRVLPNRIKVQCGYTSDEPLSDMFLVPSVEAANRRLISSLQDALQKRYQNERTFCLY